MGNRFPKLFESINIGKVTLKNRIAMAPMGINGFWDPSGTLTQRGIDYYVERARGGAGLIITGLLKVEDEIEPSGGRLPRINFGLLPALAEICEAAHALGTRVFVQLTAGWGRVSAGARFHMQPVAPSALPAFWDPSITCRPLTTAEVEKLVKAFGPAAWMAARAGVDGIELHGHEGYLFDQFTTALWNKRDDKYGGDLKGRLTFPLEVLAEIKKHAGADFPVQYRFGLKHYVKALNSGALKGEKFQEAGQDIEEGLEMAKLLEKAGFDSLQVDAGCYDSWYWAHPPVYQEHGCMVDMAARVKKIVDIPVTAVGRLDIPEMAERVIEEGQADIIALGRGLLADPEWPVKAREGRTEDIRPCIGCHDGCMGRLHNGKPLSCAVNPVCGKEKQYSLGPALKKRTVVVAGGGVAGMEAARVAALKGHQVKLFERDETLGGHLREASVPGFKEDLKRLLQWYEKQIGDLDIEVKLGTEVTAEHIRQENPDVVFIATGSKALIPALSGINNAGVITAVDLLSGRKPSGQTAVVVGGGLIGCETALWLAQQGKRVTVVEALPELMRSGMEIIEMNRLMLLDLLAFHNVGVITGARLQKIDGENVIVKHEEAGDRSLSADTVVLAVGLKPENGLYQQLAGEFARIYQLGDCREPRNIMGAIWDAYEVARGI